MQRPFIINPLLIKVNSDILDGEFNDNVLDTLVPDLVPDFNELELLSREVNINKTYKWA